MIIPIEVMIVALFPAGLLFGAGLVMVAVHYGRSLR